MQRTRQTWKSRPVKASVKLRPSIHRKATIRANNRRMSLSNWIAELVEKNLKAA